MATPATEDELHVVTADDDQEGSDEAAAENAGRSDEELESLRDEFIEAFNARDLDAVMSLLAADVECPDIPAGNGADTLAEELESIWERSPAAILTRAFVDDMACAVAWLPDEDGCWSRAALVTFDHDDGLLTMVALPDDPNDLGRAQAEAPTGGELEEWQDWAEWDRGEETVSRPRDRDRP